MNKSVYCLGVGIMLASYGIANAATVCPPGKNLMDGACVIQPQCPKGLVYDGSQNLHTTYGVPPGYPHCTCPYVKNETAAFYESARAACSYAVREWVP